MPRVAELEVHSRSLPCFTERAAPLLSSPVPVPWLYQTALEKSAPPYPQAILSPGGIGVLLVIWLMMTVLLFCLIWERDSISNLLHWRHLFFFSENAEMQKGSHLVLLFFSIIQKYNEAKANDSHSEKDQVYEVSLD